MAEKPIEDARSQSSEQHTKSVRQAQLKRSNQSSRVHQEAKARFSTNQIHQIDILQKIYRIRWSESYRIIRSLGHLLNRYIMDILWRIYKIGWSESYRPIISLRRLFNRYKRSQSSETSSRLDGQTLKLNSLMRKSRTSYAQAASSA